MIARSNCQIMFYFSGRCWRTFHKYWWQKAPEWPMCVSWGVLGGYVFTQRFCQLCYSTLRAPGKVFTQRFNQPRKYINTMGTRRVRFLQTYDTTHKKGSIQSTKENISFGSIAWSRHSGDGFLPNHTFSQWGIVSGELSIRIHCHGMDVALIQFSNVSICQRAKLLLA